MQCHAAEVRRGCQPVGPMVWRSALWTLNPATAAQIRVGPYLMLAGRAGSSLCISIWGSQFTMFRGHHVTCSRGLKSVAAQILAAWMACCAGGRCVGGRSPMAFVIVGRCLGSRAARALAKRTDIRTQKFRRMPWLRKCSHAGSGHWPINC